MHTKSSSQSKKKKTKHIGNFLYDFVKITGAIPALIWMRPKVYRPNGKKLPKGGYIISANHCSFFDPILVLCVFWQRRIYSLATKDLYANKFRTWMFTQMHCIPVDKENFSLNSLHEVTRQLKRGKVVSIYPEGQLNTEPSKILAFKSGIILMAHSAGVPIVPVYFVPLDAWWKRRVAVIGDPIDIRPMCGDFPTLDELNRAGDYVHQKEQELKDFYHEIILKAPVSNTEKQHEEVAK